MRPELKEFNYDWTLWSITNLAGRIGNASEKELACMLGMSPSFREIMDAITSFKETMTKLNRDASEYFWNILNAHKEGKKIGVISFSFPPEILYAMDIVPLMPEVLTSLGTMIWERGVAEFQDYCTEVGLTDTSCAAQRGGVGAVLSGLVEKPDMVISDTAGVCDTNSTVMAFLAEYLEIPYYQLDFPPVIDEKGKEYQRRDFREMISFLEEQTGNKLDEKRLRKVCEEVKKTDEYIIGLDELRRAVPNPVPGLFGLIEYSAKYMWGGTEKCTYLMETIYEMALERYKKGEPPPESERARGIFCYVSHFTTGMRFWKYLEEMGISHLAETLSMFSQEGTVYVREGKAAGYRIDTTNRETMIDSLADEMAYYPMLKQIRAPYDWPTQWLDEISTLVKTYRADFVCYIGTMACRNSWGCVKLLNRDIEERLGIPTLALYADAWDDRVMSWEACKDKLGEFLEMRVFTK